MLKTKLLFLMTTCIVIFIFLNISGIKRDSNFKIQIEERLKLELENEINYSIIKHIGVEEGDFSSAQFTTIISIKNTSRADLLSCFLGESFLLKSNSITEVELVSNFLCENEIWLLKGIKPRFRVQY